MKQDDYKNLQIERAQIQVSINDARSLVSKWMGKDLDDEEDDPMMVLEPSRGLGSTSKAPIRPTNLALNKLKNATNSKLKAAPVSTFSKEESSDEEIVTKASKRKQVTSVLDAYKLKKKKKHNK